jgi:hypothetical protein
VHTNFLYTVIEFGGIYQYCDGGQCDPQCMSPNIWTGGCNCPGIFLCVKKKKSSRKKKKEKRKEKK